MEVETSALSGSKARAPARAILMLLGRRLPPALAQGVDIVRHDAGGLAPSGIVP